MTISSDRPHSIWLTLRHRTRQLVVVLLILAIVLLALRIALPFVVQRYVNNKLDESPAYAGQVGDIDIALIRGAYSIDNIEIVKTEGDVPVPLFAAREVEFSLLWKALFRGQIVGEAELYEPVINIVDSEDEAKQQNVKDGNWVAIADDLTPLLIDQVQIHDGQLHFQNFDTEPPIDIYLKQINGNARNLSNSQALTDSSVGHIEITALAMDESELAVNAAVDASREEPTFDLNLKLLSLPMSNLDSFIKTYAPFDIEAGTLDLVTEMAARDGVLEGYVKPIIYNLQVFKWSEDVGEDHDNPFRLLWEGLVNIVTELLENQPRDQFATNIPIDGDISNPETSMFTAVVNILRNAFVEAFQANLDNSISLFEDDEEMPRALPEPLEPAPELATESAARTTDETADKSVNETTSEQDQ
ncbi:MAG: DUF748 domain-containing protein [Pseudomonadota bacterium]